MDAMEAAVGMHVSVSHNQYTHILYARIVVRCVQYLCV